MLNIYFVTSLINAITKNIDSYIQSFELIWHFNFAKHSVRQTLDFHINSCVDYQITVVFFIACMEKSSQHLRSCQGNVD